MHSDREQFEIGYRGCWGALATLAASCLLAVTFSLPAFADGRERHARRACSGLIEEFTITSDDGSQVMVSLDQIVPEDLQGMIRTDPGSLTGIWISDIDLWTDVNALACQLPKVLDCPEGALEGACPTLPPTSNLFSCGDSSTWANNTFAIYELTTGSLYALNLWRVWSQQEYPTIESLRAAKPPVIYSGFSFQNGVRNLDGGVYMITSLGEVDTIGAGTGPSIVLTNKISMQGRVYPSNVGRVIISEARTETAVSLVYSPTSPKQAVWKLNLRRLRRCVTGSTFEDFVFPPRREIRIESD